MAAPAVFVAIVLTTPIVAITMRVVGVVIGTMIGPVRVAPVTALAPAVAVILLALRS